jgi:hypothetical protein
VRCTTQTSFSATCIGSPPRSLFAWVWAWAALGLCVLMLAASPGARAEVISLDSFELARNDEGLVLSFAARFHLAPAVEDALQKGVPLFFVAQAEVFRDRWYWRDKEVNSVTRTWRLAYQPLTRKYRVTFGGLSQHYDSLADALGSVSRTANWKLADIGQLDDGGHYVEFSYQLDTTQMPRPMQIGIGGQPDWTLRIQRIRRLN